MSRQSAIPRRTVILSSEWDCVRLLQEPPNPSCHPEWDELFGLVLEQELMLGIERLLRAGTLACK